MDRPGVWILERCYRKRQQAKPCWSAFAAFFRCGDRNPCERDCVDRFRVSTCTVDDHGDLQHRTRVFVEAELRYTATTDHRVLDGVLRRFAFRAPQNELGDEAGTRRLMDRYFWQ